MVKITPKKIVVSRTDSIGDVILTLPLAGILKKHFPGVELIFLGNTYTKSIIECCEHVDEVWEWAVLEKLSYDEQKKWMEAQGVDTFLHIFPRKEIARLAKKANIPIRIGTSHRAFHLLSCNKTVNFTRKRSDLHEAQLNTKLLAPLGIKEEFSLEQLTEFIGFTKIPDMGEELKARFDASKKSVVLHPKSQGSAVEWGVSKFMELASSLDTDKYQVFITGTEKESEFFRSQIPSADNIIDLSGKMTLEQLVGFIAHADCLVAASTGPLHIAGVTGIKTIGLFSEVRPIHPGRWRPLGNKVSVLTPKKNSPSTQPLLIDVRDVVQEIESQ